MEPAAPGTEEDVQAPPVSKKTSEQERLLSITAYLPNGDYGNVFELTYNNGCEQWYCKVCKCPIMGRVFYHEGGKRHSLNMALGNKNFKSQSPTPAPQEDAPPTEEVPSIKVAPGEPVPPGFEGEITKVAQIQDRLDSFRSGSLLGLEYLLEIQDYDHEKEPSYLCLLCGKKGDPRTVIAHLVSYNHIQSYLQRHFQKTYTALAPFVTRQYKKNWQDTVNKIAEAIETKYGRLLPHPVDAETFEKKKEELYSLVYLGPHFSEKNGVTFEHLVNKDEITKVSEGDNSKDYGVPNKNTPKKRSPSPPIVNKPKKPKPANSSSGGLRRRSLSSVSSISSSDLSDFDEKKTSKSKPIEHRSKFSFNRRRSRSRSRSRSPIARRQPYSRRSPPRGRSGYRGRDRNMPWNRPDYVRSSRNDTPNDNRRKVKDDKMEEFKRLATAIENDMDKVLKQHKTNPEKHPQYSDEWKIFWKKRYNELQAEGKDASNYDFKPEWILYWNEKIVELHKHEVRNKIEALRKRLGVAEPTPISFKIGSKRRTTSQDSKLAPMASQPDQDHEVIVIDDKDDDSLGSKRSRTPLKTRSPQRSNSPRRSRSRRRSKSPIKTRSPPKSRSPRSHSPWESEPVPRSKVPSKRLSLDRVSSPEKEGDMLGDTSADWYHTRDRSRERGPPYTHREYISTEREYRTHEKSWKRDISYHRESRRDIYKPPPFMRDVTREPYDYNKHSNVKSGQPEPPEEEDDGNVNTVAVLRLLTALEDKLGSLGPKIIDMLATALAMEKKEPNSSENLLDNEINCVLFETVKEKLKGALHAGLVDFHQEKAYKIAIKKIASLIHLAGQRKVEKENSSVDPVKVPGIGTVDKAAIAKQIATALVLQGKTDVSHTELEQLINAVVGMAEASKNSGKPITTASFLESLSKKEEPMVKLVSISPPPSTSVETQSNTDAIEGLSDSDLQTLLQNFKDLSTEEQHGLITYLKKMEAKEPERVEKLRRYVNLGQEENVKETEGRISPFSRKLKHVEENVDVDNNAYDYFDDDQIEDTDESKEVKVEEVKVSKVKIDSDDEEYSYEDVFKAANKNVEESKIVKEKEESLKKESKASENDVLNDAKALIANIMGSIASKSNPRINSPIADSLNIEKSTPNLPVSQPISTQYVPPNNQPQTSSLPSYTAPVMQTNVSTTFRPQNTPIRPISSNGPRPPIQNQNVQYPIKNNPYNSYGNPYGNNFNFQNQFKHNSRYNQPRGYYPNPNNNNRGGGNFSKRW